jgi:prepilin-type N-terminal cleavage/methylation domain-containing protein
MNYMKNNGSHKNGFTIIELLVATVVFSLILIVATAAIIQVGRMYYRGITYARTQEVVRNTTEEIAQAIQFSTQPIKVPNYPSGVVNYGPIIDVNLNGAGEDTFYFCVGPKRYSFAVDRMLVNDSPDQTKKEKRHVLWVDEPPQGCADAISMEPADLTQEIPSENGRELLGEKMRINEFSLQRTVSGLWLITFSVAHGDEDLLGLNEQGRRVCEGNRFGIELCAVSEISTNVNKRVK